MDRPGTECMTMTNAIEIKTHFEQAVKVCEHITLPMMYECKDCGDYDVYVTIHCNVCKKDYNFTIWN